MTPPLPGTPASERRIDQRECATKGCAWEGQRWDALSKNDGELCPACRRPGKATGVTVYVGDAEKHLEKHDRVVDRVVAGEEVAP